MVTIEHHDAAQIAKTTPADFSFITLHTRTGAVIRWTWHHVYNTSVGAEQYSYCG